MKLQEQIKSSSKKDKNNPEGLEQLLVKRKLQNKVLKKIADHLAIERNEITQKNN